MMVSAQYADIVGAADGTQGAVREALRPGRLRIPGLICQSVDRENGSLERACVERLDGLAAAYDQAESVI